KDIDRTAAGYEFIKRIDKATEDEPEPDYFELLRAALEALNNFEIELQITKLWFNLRLLKLAGHAPNLKTSNQGEKLIELDKFTFDLDQMAFAPSSAG